VNRVKRYWLGLIVLIALFFVACAGCTAPAGPTNASENTTSVPGTIAASYRATLNQPEAQSGYIVMDTDIFNEGEVVEFSVTNHGTKALSCAGNPPSFSVKFQGVNGIWATRMGPGQPNETEQSTLAPGTSTKVYRFVTSGWEPGRYRIVHDCGIVREILVRPLATPVPTPTLCPVTNASASPVITIDPIGDKQANAPLTITGTTTIPAGQELRYMIVPAQSDNPFGSTNPDDFFISVVQEGTCGTNTWSAMGEIQATGEFLIGITDTNRNATAIKRFSVTAS
jgi:hypothetical protein